MTRLILARERLHLRVGTAPTVANQAPEIADQGRLEPDQQRGKDESTCRDPGDEDLRAAKSRAVQRLGDEQYTRSHHARCCRNASQGPGEVGQANVNRSRGDGHDDDLSRIICTTIATDVTVSP